MLIKTIEDIFNNIFKNNNIEEKATITVSNRPDVCDYQCNDVFKIAKKVGKNPIEIGGFLVEEICKIDNFDNLFESVVFCPPGFINIKLSSKFINENLTLINTSLINTVTKPEKQTVVLDYGGPNVAKPLHVGHMRTAIVGESIKRICEFFGNNVISDIHLGDIGLQIGQVIYKVLEDNLTEDDINLEYLEVTYPNMSGLCKENSEVKEKCAYITKELQEGKEAYVKLWKKICELSVSDMKQNYNYLNVSFDYWLGESDAYKYIPKLYDISKSKLVESEGALVIPVEKSTDKNGMPPLIFKKSNGAYLYSTSDLATILQRKEDFNPNKIIYITDLRQSLHFEQVFRASDSIGLCEYNTLEHVGYGTVNGDDNKPFKTRSGKTPKLSELFVDAKDIFIAKKDSNNNLSNKDLDIITNSILKYADLQNSPERDYIFDLSKFSEVNGKTGPYILYTYLRIRKMLDAMDGSHTLSPKIYNEQDKNLRLYLLQVSRCLEGAYNDRKPNYIADYLYNLCSYANIFYQNNYLNTLEDEINRKDWEYVLNVTSNVIKELLYLLVIDVPSEM